MSLRNIASLTLAISLLTSCAATRPKSEKPVPSSEIENSGRPIPSPKIVTVEDEKLTDAAIRFLATPEKDDPGVYEKRRHDFEAALAEYFSRHDSTTDSLTLQVQREGMTFIFPVKFVTLDSMRTSAFVKHNVRRNLQQADHDAHVTLVFEQTQLEAGLNTHFGLAAVVWSNVVETLFRINDEGETIPILASGIASDSTGRVWQIQLREGVYFSEGSMLTAEEVRKSWQRNMQADKQSDGASRWLWTDIIGAEEYVDKNGGVMAGLQVTGEHALKITLKEPRPNFVEYLTQPCFGVTRSRGDGKGLIGTGPFAIAEIKSQDTGTTLICTRNQYYHGDQPLLREIRFVFDNGNVFDALMKEQNSGTIVKKEKDIEYFRQIETYSIRAFPVSPVYFLALNPGIDPLSNSALRQYITTTVLRRWEIADIVTEAEGEVALALFAEKPIHAPPPAKDALPGRTNAVRIAFRERDGVARQIAERLAARFAQLQIPARPPQGLSDRDFENLRQAGTYFILVDSFIPTFATTVCNLSQLMENGYSVDLTIREELAAARAGSSLDDADAIEKKLIEQAVFHPLVRANHYAVLPAELRDAKLLSNGLFDFSRAWIPK